MPASSPLYDLTVRRIDGVETSLADFAGTVLLIVNVASECGLTPQYEGLERLYSKYRNRDFAVLGFPSNEFSAQEPGSNEEIQVFCRSVYGVDFPMFAKIELRGTAQIPLYRLLTDAQPRRLLGNRPKASALKLAGSKDVRWNFEKFLVDRNGKVTARFDPDIAPEDPLIVGAIERALAA